LGRFLQDHAPVCQGEMCRAQHGIHKIGSLLGMGYEMWGADPHFIPHISCQSIRFQDKMLRFGIHKIFGAGMSSHLIGVVLALISAAVYGGADFFGGFATRRSHPFQVLVLAGTVSILVQAALGLAFGESLPTWPSMFWGSLSGVAGFLGLMLLYRGLADGNSAIVSPIAGVAGAAVPVIFNAFVLGLPQLPQLLGMGVAIPGILLVTLTASGGKISSRASLLYGLFGGIFFGLYFITVGHIEKDAAFYSLMVSKVVFTILGLVMVAVLRLKLPAPRANPFALLAGLIDPIGNSLYLIASHYTRMDVAAVLSSLYPAGTVFLSLMVFKEKVSRLQWVGVALCLAAIALITV
jgi:drug/metabolite transporter (DMT)-like permease